VSTTFWDGAPSYYIYTIEEFTAVSVPKSKVNRIFDYDLDYYPEGLIPVAEIDLVTILRRLNLFYRDTAKNTDEGTVNTMADHDFLRRSVIPVRGRTRSLRQGFV